jgi:uncharacterized membrane protein YeaQ/YmgE (transglycosylase-associated protein family)
MNITLVTLVILLVIAGVCGTLGQRIAGYSGGVLTSIVVGFIGAMLGLWLAENFRLPELFTLNVDGQRFPVIWSIIGSALFVAAFGLFSRRGSHRRGWFASLRR